jgi:non-haem Fe2+, alpha-ketoglutarate-dependent halogenase
MSDKRILKFFPSAGQNLQRLSVEQVAAFNENGYLSPFAGLNAEETQKHAEYFNGLMAENKARGGDAYALNCKHPYLRDLYDMVLHPNITSVIRDLLGNDFHVWACHYFNKEAGDIKKVAWHQDASYWPLSPSKTVTVWLAIDDSDVENSAMQVIPKSHLHGLLKWKEVEGPAVLNQELVGTEDMHKPVSLCLKAGQFSIHSDLTAHGSLPNRSNRRRCGLTIRYCPSDVQAINKTWGQQAIHCSGKKSPNWNYIERPAFNDIETALSVADPALAAAAR